jgi:hypothetical protein
MVNCRNCNCYQTIWHTFQFWGGKSPLLLRVTLRNFSFLKKNVNSYFPDICNYEATIRFISVQFDANAESVMVKFKIEMTDLQCDMYMRNIFRHVILLDFHKFYLLADKFPMLSYHACAMTTLFRSALKNESDQK